MSETLQRYAIAWDGQGTPFAVKHPTGDYVLYADAQRRIEKLEEILQAIADWCDAYPVDVFGEPDMREAARLLGDELLSKLSAHNFRHVFNGIRKKIDAALRK